MSEQNVAMVKPHAATIAWWMAAGLVGADIGTSVFYSSGVLYPLVGFAAPFFVLLVVLCMWFFKLTYQEGTSVSPLNGGAYTMVLQTIGRRAALVVGSLTILSYLATAVVSALSGSLYLSSLWGGWPTWLVVVVAATPVVVFAALNLLGLKESTKVVFAVACFHFSMLILMDAFGVYLALTHGAHWGRLLRSFHGLGPQQMILGFASAFLGITGFESAAQIVEEIEAPTEKSIRKIYTTIVALVSITAPFSAFLVMLLLNDAQIGQYKDAFLSGLAVVEGGHWLMVLLVLNACFTLFAAVNTAYAGATGLMTTMGKQGNLPAIVLHQWDDKVSFLKGFPFVALPFMSLCLLMMVAFPGQVDQLGSIYGMAFLGVMISYSIGVVLLRLHQPLKVARAPWVSHWVFKWGKQMIPFAPVIGGSLLLVAELTQLITAQQARSLGLQLFLAVLLVMVYYRLGKVEDRMVALPDLRLGLGRFRGLAELPELPVYVVCTTGAHGSRLVTVISHMLKAYGDGIEIVLFHAEERTAQHGVVGGELERLVSQQLEDFYSDKDFILSVKVLPGTLVEVLPEYRKMRHFDHCFVTSGHNAVASEALREHLSNELGIEVVLLDEESLAKGPGVWFTQWSQSYRSRES
ncbi:MAG TPA: APC family permease [Oscillatoriaceae cyanobacterium]